MIDDLGGGGGFVLGEATDFEPGLCWPPGLGDDELVLSFGFEVVVFHGYIVIFDP